MNKISLIITFLVLPFGGLCQNMIRLYFNQKLPINQSNKVHNLRFQSVTAQIYLTKDRIKTDSIFIESDDFSIWKDTVSFSVAVPTSFINKAKEISMLPLYNTTYITKTKGDKPIQLRGKLETVNQIKLKIKSEPSGAIVFLIPKFLWERNPLFQKHDQNLLSHYIVASGPTTTYANVQEYVYIAVFLYKNIFKNIECSPNHISPVDSIFLKLN